MAGLVQGSDGYFYGTTEYGGTNGGNGTVFKISANGALTSLYSFTGGNDGANPVAGLVQGSDGYFYGTTSSTVFQNDPCGALTTLVGIGLFSPSALVQGTDGSFYGTTVYGAGYSVGTIFRLTIVPEIQAMTLTRGTLNLTWSTEAGGPTSCVPLLT